MSLALARAALEAATLDGSCPGAAAVVLHRGRAVLDAAVGLSRREPAPWSLGPSDLFDLASLTKLHVASLAARLVERGRLQLDAPAAPLLATPPAAWEGVTLRHLLAHASGLAAWHPWYELAAQDPLAAPAFRAPGERPGASALVPALRRARRLLEEALAREPLEAPPGTRALYSDLGFIALGLLLERVAGTDLDVAVEREVLSPLALGRTGFLSGLAPDRAAGRRAALERGGARFVATRRSPARGGELLCGAVDDDNAWALGGVAGHAGLFAPAAEVAAFGQAWLEALAGRSAWLRAETARRFTARDATPGSERALGWDTPSSEGSSLGSRLGRGRLGAVGHLGFTGTSLWIDRDQELVCALLTNHVHPGGPDRPRLRALRRRFHDAVAADLGIA